MDEGRQHKNIVCLIDQPLAFYDELLFLPWVKTGSNVLEVWIIYETECLLLIGLSLCHFFREKKDEDGPKNMWKEGLRDVECK